MYSLLSKYKKDRNMINEELYQEKLKYELLDTNNVKKTVKAPAVDPILAMDMRHAKVDLKREQRIKDKNDKIKNEKEVCATQKENKMANKVMMQSIDTKGCSDVEDQEKIKEKRIEIEADTKKLSEDVKMIAENVKQKAEEFRKLDKAKRLQEKQMEEKKRMQEEAEKLKKLHEEAERKNKEFKLGCVFGKIEQLKRMIIRTTFSALVKCSIHLKIIDIKVNNFINNS